MRGVTGGNGFMESVDKKWPKGKQNYFFSLKDE